MGDNRANDGPEVARPTPTAICHGAARRRAPEALGSITWSARPARSECARIEMTIVMGDIRTTRGTPRRDSLSQSEAVLLCQITMASCLAHLRPFIGCLEWLNGGLYRPQSKASFYPPLCNLFMPRYRRIDISSSP